MRLKAFLLAVLLVAPTASRVTASGHPQAKPDADPKNEEKIDEKRKIVVEIPDIDTEMLADLEGLDELPDMVWFEGGGYIGIRPLEMTPELRTHFGAPKEAGVFVGTVEKDSPASRAGLQVGDIVTSADGEKVERKRDLVRAIRRKKEGDAVRIELVRNRAPLTLTVTVAEREDGRIRVGDFGPGMREFHHRRVRPLPPVPPVPPVPPAAPEFQERLDEFEKRLDALESRLPQKQSF